MWLGLGPGKSKIQVLFGYEIHIQTRLGFWKSWKFEKIHVQVVDISNDSKIDLWKILALFNNSQSQVQRQNPVIVWLKIERKSKENSLKQVKSRDETPSISVYKRLSKIHHAFGNMDFLRGNPATVWIAVKKTRKIQAKSNLIYNQTGPWWLRQPISSNIHQWRHLTVAR